MKLVAVVRPAGTPEQAARAVAAATGLTLAEARMRLSPEPPALLARLEDGRAEELVAALRGAGVSVVAVDVRCPTDRDRVLARGFALDGAGLTVEPRAGGAAVLPWSEVTAILRGVRASRVEVERTETSRHLSVGTAIATGGLKLTRTTTRQVRSSDETTEQVILVYARGGRTAALAEGQLEFSCLGAGMQPSSAGNMAELARRLRERAPRAFYDERLMRLGRRALPFLGGGDSRSQSGAAVTTRTDTSGSLDVLAEVMRRALEEGLLP